jgi:hypothetical protein
VINDFLKIMINNSKCDIMKDLLQLITDSKRKLNKNLKDYIEDWTWDILKEIYESEKLGLIRLGFLNTNNEIKRVMAVGEDDWTIKVEKFCPAIFAVESGEVQNEENIINKKNCQEWREEVLKIGFNSLIAIPIKKPETEEIFGILCCYSMEEKYFTEPRINKLKQIIEEISPLLLMIYDPEDINF